MKKQLTILLLEDNTSDVKLLKRALSKSFDNFEMKVIETKAEYLAELPKPYDIIISDYSLPAFDGMEALIIRNKEKPFLPFIITTGSTNEATAVRCMKAGAEDYVIKEHITRIGEAVKRAIALKNTENEKQLADQNVRHLNRILRAIQNINQLIIREHNDQELIQKACEMFTAAHSYSAAWISLFDDKNKLGKINAYSGINPKEFNLLTENMQKDDWPPCLKIAHNSKKQIRIKHNDKVVEQCPMGEFHLSSTALCRLLVYNNKKLGFITVTVPQDVAINAEEDELFREVTNDISYALFNMQAERESRDTALRQKVLFDIAHAAASKEELNNFLPEVFEIIKQVVEFDHAYVALYDAKKHLYTFPYERDKENAIYPDTLPDSIKGLIEYVRRKRKLTIVTKPRLEKLEKKGEVKRLGPYQAVWMGIPLVSQDNFIGVMALMHFNNPLAFSKKDEALMSFISNQLALFIERKEAILQLKASNERYKTIMKEAGDAILIFDMDGKILDANEKTAKSLGYSLNEFLQMKAFDLVPPALAKKQKAQYWDKFSLGQMIEFETVFLRKNGTEFPVEINSGLVIIGNENFVLSIARDITERKKAEEKIRQLSLGVEQSPASIVITDLEGNIQYVNKKFTEVSGYTAAEALGQNPRVLKSGKMPDSLYTELWATISAGKEWQGEMINRRKNQSLYWELVSISPVKDPHGEITHYIAVKEDITRRKELDAELLKAKQKAEESNKLKSEFLANMSHEIRTPMNGIIGFASLLEDDELGPESRKNYVNIIQNSTRQLLHIIDEILEVSKLQTHQVKKEDTEVNLNEMLIQCFSEFDKVAKNKGLSLYVKKGLSDEAARIYVDEEKLHKILDNLLENALKFTQQGHVEIGYRHKKDKLEFFVKDTGRGIGSGAQHLVFEQFSQEDKRLSRVSGGLGLGLSIVKGNVALLNGKIRLESAKGKGSTFFVEIPYNPVNPEMNLMLAEASESAAERITILVTEDEEVNYQYLEILLKKYNPDIKVLHAINGREAVTLCKEHPNIRLVLMDIKMPEMGGLEATRLIKDQNPDIIVVAQTAYTALENQEDAKEAGCSAFLRKPTRKVFLFNILDQYLKESEQHIDETE
jgi:PAS domain S-box-containing protein